MTANAALRSRPGIRGWESFLNKSTANLQKYLNCQQV
jgi:hypothetical protein